MRILAELLSLFTGDRQRVVAGTDFRWSKKSWTYNLFRVYELVFWRKAGIRLEQVSSVADGRVKSYTWENYFATVEGEVRAWLKKLFKQLFPYKIVVLFPVTPQGTVTSPFLFAIALDTSTDIQPTVPAGSITGTHTSTGSNLIMFFCSAIPNTDAVTAVSYNSVSGTFIDKRQGTSDRFIYEHYLINPATGANTVAITAAGSDATDSVIVTYSGAAQSGQPDATAGNAGGTAITSIAATVTVVASNCWIIGWSYNNQGAATFNGTNRQNLGGNTARPINDSNGTVATGGNTWTESWSVAGSGAIIVTSIAPVAAVGTRLRRLTGIGL